MDYYEEIANTAFQDEMEKIAISIEKVSRAKWILKLLEGPAETAMKALSGMGRRADPAAALKAMKASPRAISPMEHYKIPHGSSGGGWKPYQSDMPGLEAQPLNKRLLQMRPLAKMDDLYPEGAQMGARYRNYIANIHAKTPLVEQMDLATGKMIKKPKSIFQLDPTDKGKFWRSRLEQPLAPHYFRPGSSR
ncbi:MAG: hypothetical protein KKD44_28420 [Proteobacteria bacterium]|nr:hypothetical protein [Pseudomonadota bacterium]